MLGREEIEIVSRQQWIASARTRLQGSWRSDAEKTVSVWVFPKRLAAWKYKFFKSIFGKTTWHFSDKNIHGEFENEKSTTSYRIIWASERSAVILIGRGKNQQCHHLFFDGEHFYFSAGRTGNVEYFKKVTHDVV